MPELVAMYSVGLVVSMIVGIIFGLKQRSKYHDPAIKHLQKNLRKIGFRWNELNLAVEKMPASFDEDPDLTEYKKARFTSILFTTAAVLFSWLGCFFLILMWFSLKLLNKSRVEKALLASPLSEKELAAQEVKEVFERVQAEALISIN